MAVPTSAGGLLNGPSTGTAQRNGGQSLPTFISSLVSGLAIFGVEFGLFLLLNNRFGRI